MPSGTPLPSTPVRRFTSVPRVRFHKIHHVGYVVPDLDAAIALHERQYGVGVVVREVLPDQGVEAAALEVGTGQIELIQPVDPDGSVARYLERRGAGLHHTAFEVEDLDATLQELEASGVTLIDRTPRRGLGGHRIAFLHPKSTGGALTELVDAHHGGSE